MKMAHAPFPFPSGSMCQQEMSMWLVSTEGRRLLIGRSLGESGPAGVSGADTVNTERRRVDRSLTNGHQPTGTSAIDPPARRDPWLPGWSVSKGLWCVALSIPGWDTGAAEGNCIGDEFSIGARGSRKQGKYNVHLYFTMFHTTATLWLHLFKV